MEAGAMMRSVRYAVAAECSPAAPLLRETGAVQSPKPKLLDRVRHDHRLHVRSQGKSSMAGAGTDIEDALIPGRVCEGHHQLEVPAGLVLAGGVRLCRFLPASLKNAHPVSLRRRC